MSDTVERLRAALDKAEAEAREGRSDAPPGWVLKLIQRDRALLTEYVEDKAALDRRTADGARFLLGVGELRGSVKDGWTFAGRVNTLRSQVERAAEFWLSQEGE